MKKIKLLGVFLISFIVMSLNVNALEVSDEESFKTCLTGTETTCVLKEDITLNSAIELTGEKNVKLDLNGKTLTVGGMNDIKDKYTLTITGNGKIIGIGNTAKYLFRVMPEGTLIIENGTYENKYAGGGVFRVIGSNVNTDTLTKLNVKAGNLIGDYGISIYGYNYDDHKPALGKQGYVAEGITVDFAGNIEAKYMGFSVNGNIKYAETDYPVININDGAKINANTGLYAAGYSKWNLGKATFNTVETGLGIKAGQIYIDGATVTTTGENNPNPTKWGNGINASGAAIQIETNKDYSDHIILDIKSGSFTSKQGYSLLEYIGETTLVSFTISGGTFTSAEDLDVFKTTEKLDLTGTITGGTYSSNVKDYVAEGYAVAENNGVYVVAEEKTTEINTIDTKEEVKDVTVGILDKDYTENVLLDSIENNEDVKDLIGDTPVKVEVEISDIKEDKIDKETKKSIEKKAGNAVIATYFDITVAVKNSVTEDQITTLPELTKEIELVILLPKDLRVTKDNVEREYFVIREHDGKVEKIPATLSKDGKYLTFKSKYFSTYALAYEDTEIKNPQTSDSITTYLLAGTISVIGFVGVCYYIKKKELFN